MTENITEHWSNMNKLSPCSRKILHDPECENWCCSKNFEKSVESSDYDLEQLLNELDCNSVESTATPVVSDNQSLYYDTISFYDTQVPECREVSHSGIGYSNLITVGQAEIKQNQIEAKRNQNHCKGVIKRKRKRTVFTTEQIIVMEGVFKKRPYVCKEERQFLTKKLNVSEKAIKVWFQNRRRVTEKKEKGQCDSCNSDSATEDMCDTRKARLDYIESQINENTDEYGFVTLSNKAISELVKVIDSVLSHNTDCDKSSHQNNAVSQSESYLMYEPISPGSTSEETTENENILKWKPSEPEESLQRLIDIQPLLYM